MRHVAPSTVTALGDAWASSSANVSAFRCEGLVSHGDRQVGAFYGPAGEVVVFVRNLTHDTVETATIPPAGANDLPFDAHRAISLGIDREGAIHLGYGAHASAARILRGGPDLALSGFHAARPDLARVTHTVTYPTFMSCGRPERLVMLYREGVPDAGAMRIRHFDEGEARWVDPALPLLDGRGHRNSAGPYFNRPLALADGSLAAFLVWRLRLAASAGERLVNTGLDLVALRGADLDRVETFDGLALPRPAGPLHVERVAAAPFASDLMNQAGAAIDPAGNPAAVTWWREPASDVPQYRLVHRRAGAWHTLTASAFTTPFSLFGKGTLALPHSRPALLFAPDGRALVLFRSAERDGALVATILAPGDPATPPEHVVLWPDDLGHYEPVVDVAAWHARGRLSLFVQSCIQHHGDEAHPTTQSAPCFVAEWDRSTVLGD